MQKRYTNLRENVTKNVKAMNGEWNESQIKIEMIRNVRKCVEILTNF